MNSTPGQRCDRRKIPHIIGSAVLSAAIDTAVVFGVLGWLYAAIIAMLYPGALSIPIVSLIPIRRDTFGILCFAASGIAYFIREMRRPLHRL